MLKKILAIVLTMSMTSSFASPVSDLQSVFDEFNYAMTVEWDQKDSGFYDRQVEVFAKRLQGLHAQGITNQQIVDQITSQLSDASQIDLVQRTYSQMELNDLTDEDISNFLVDLENTYDHGASWNGRTNTIIIGSFILIGVAIVVLSVLNSHHGDSNDQISNSDNSNSSGHGASGTNPLPRASLVINNPLYQGVGSVSSSVMNNPLYQGAGGSH